MTATDEIGELVQSFRSMGRDAAEQVIAEGQDIADIEPIVALVAEQVMKLAKKPDGAALLTQAAAAALYNETLAAYQKRLQELQRRDASIGGASLVLPAGSQSGFLANSGFGSVPVIV
jgi:hypothetical protein